MVLLSSVRWPLQSILSTNYRPPLQSVDVHRKFSRLSVSIVLAKNFTGETGTVQKNKNRSIIGCFVRVVDNIGNPTGHPVNALFCCKIRCGRDYAQFLLHEQMRTYVTTTCFCREYTLFGPFTHTNARSQKMASEASVPHSYTTDSLESLYVAIGIQLIVLLFKVSGLGLCGTYKMKQLR